MDYNNKTYVIFNVSEIDKIDFSQVDETSVETVRKSVDGTKTFVKYYGNIPSSVSSLTTKEGSYTHEQILTILNTSEWVKQSPPSGSL